VQLANNITEVAITASGAESDAGTEDEGSYDDEEAEALPKSKAIANFPNYHSPRITQCLALSKARY
jgi:hypothetical protein